MSRPVPLMFVNGPPVYTHVPLTDEESTSMFVREEKPAKSVLEESEKKEVNPVILEKVKKLQSPIGQRVYQQLTFVLDQEEIIGNVIQVDEQTLTVVEVDHPEKKTVIELSELKNIIWRGKPLPGN